MSEDRDLNDGVPSEETEIKPTPITEEKEQETEFHPFDEIHDDFKPTGKKVTAEDGLPTVQGSEGNEHIPPLSPETLVCMGDFRKFVKRDLLGNIVSEYTPDEVEELPNGLWVLKEGLEYIKTQLSSGKYGRIDNVDRKVVYARIKKALIDYSVDPIRKPCSHYVRQLGIGSGQVTTIYRLCAARRTTEGTFMTVRDTAVWACSMREPRDIQSERRHLDVFDERKEREGANRVNYSIFSDKGLG